MGSIVNGRTCRVARYVNRWQTARRASVRAREAVLRCLSVVTVGRRRGVCRCVCGRWLTTKQTDSALSIVVVRYSTTLAKQSRSSFDQRIRRWLWSAGPPPLVRPPASRTTRTRTLFSRPPLSGTFGNKQSVSGPCHNQLVCRSRRRIAAPGPPSS